MKIAVRACFVAEGDMEVEAGHFAKVGAEQLSLATRERQPTDMRTEVVTRDTRATTSDSFRAECY